MNLYRVTNTGIIIFITLFCISTTSSAFCPVPFIPDSVTCEGQGGLKWTGPKHPSDMVSSNGQKSISISGGCPPYSWSVSGEGYWLENDLTYEPANIVYSDSEIDCLARVIVIDKFGNQVTGFLRASGRWIKIGNECIIPGPKTRKLDRLFWERVQGRYRQTQGYGYDYWNGTCLHNEPPCGNQAYSCIPDPNPGIECITLESTGAIDGYDRREFPCFWQSPEKWSEQNGDTNHSFCTKRGALGWTSMACFKAGLIRLYEWRCD